jgi:hypothetical protein
LEDRALRRAMRRSERSASLSTVGMLRRELGVLGAAGVLADVLGQRLRGAPFSELGPPADRREALTRRQAAPAVQLHRALRRRVDAERAYALTRDAVLAGGLVFLRGLLGDLDPERDSAGSDVAERLGELAGRFFNAEGELAMDGGRAVTFDVSRCRFVELLDAIDARELAPLFCEVDRAYFTPEQTPIRLSRGRTLAGGDDRCDFRFEW